MENKILTPRELEVIKKKLKNEKITQLDSNILTRSIRPKLKEIISINANYLLERLSYNPKNRAIENQIKKTILKNIVQVEAIIVIGSAIQTSYNKYNDIDIIIVTKNKIWDKIYEREEIIYNLEKDSKKIGLNLDIQIISKKALLNSYSKNPSLIYQLKDYKVIYGKINIPKKIELSKLDLLMKLDWSEPTHKLDGRELYECIRNLWLVKLLMKKVIDNEKLYSEIINELGRNLIIKLKNNKASKLEKILALNYLIDMVKETEKELKGEKWEKIVLLNH